MKNKNRIKLVFLLFFILGILLITTNVQAAGINGTTIVLNPRAWWKLYRLC